MKAKINLFYLKFTFFCHELFSYGTYRSNFDFNFDFDQVSHSFSAGEVTATSVQVAGRLSVSELSLGGNVQVITRLEMETTSFLRTKGLYHST